MNLYLIANIFIDISLREAQFNSLIKLLKQSSSTLFVSKATVPSGGGI